MDREGGTTRGAGGDRTLVIDSAAEDVVFAELEALHEQGHDFTAISEERGEVAFGDGASEVRVVIDPIDGSLNAKRLIPTYSLSIAVASGDTMEDVEFGFVHDFGTGEEFVATRDEGATLNGEVLDTEIGRRGARGRRASSRRGRSGSRRSPRSSRATCLQDARDRDDRAVALLRGRRALRRHADHRHLPLGGRRGRAADRARGRRVRDVLGHGGIEAPLDLDARYRMVAARSPERLETLVRALAAGRPLGD